MSWAAARRDPGPRVGDPGRGAPAINR